MKLRFKWSCTCIIIIFLCLYLSDLGTIIMIHLSSRGTGFAHDDHSSVFLPAGSYQNPIAVTVITAFLDIGDHKRKTGEYLLWMKKSWNKIKNPVVFYTNNPAFGDQFMLLRTNLSTRVIFVKSTELPSFKLIARINATFSRSGYPQHYPSTTNPAYAAVQHAKYDLVQHALRNNVFKTDYLMWLDIGYFRNMPSSCTPFTMTLPSNFNKSMVAFAQVYRQQSNTTSCKHIIRRNKVWVGGGLFFGQNEVLCQFVSEYSAFTSQLLSDGWFGTDQLHLSCLYTDPKYSSLRTVPLQTYDPLQLWQYSLDRDDWFTFGYALRNRFCMHAS